jgi:EPS-associated MarR family transcriptional regulator
MPATLTAEVRYRLLKYLAEHPEASQRDLARELGVSVGKVNYCLRALIEKGWIKARNFRNSRHKAAYLYVLTPNGVEEKVNVTTAFLRRKLDEYELLTKEIERLTREVSELGSASSPES